MPDTALCGFPSLALYRLLLGVITCDLLFFGVLSAF